MAGLWWAREIRERLWLKRITPLVRSVKENIEEIYNLAFRLVFRSDGDLSALLQNPLKLMWQLDRATRVASA